MPWKIKCWIEVEEDEQEPFYDLSSAVAECKHLELMQPENIYKVVECNEEREEL